MRRATDNGLAPSSARGSLPVAARRRGLIPTARRAPLPARGRENQEFLPAHLEILVTPASPYATLFIWVVGAMFVAVFFWSYFARIDIFSIGSGRLEPDGRSKILQPFETSRVLALHAGNGTQVKAGDLLVELEPTAAAADVASGRSDIDALNAQIARREAVISAIKRGSAAVDPRFDEGVPTPIAARERAAMHADIAKYVASRDSLLAQIDEKAATEARLSSSIIVRQRLVTALKSRETMRQTLVDKYVGSKASVIDATQQVEQASADLAYDLGQRTETAAAKASLKRKIDELSAQAMAEQTQALAEAFEKQSSLQQNLIKAEYKLRQMRLVAPISGTVQQLAVTTLGQVVSPGQPLLVIVPSDSSIELQALISSKDVGFVAEGQEAVVKIDAFPFTRYGAIAGTVLHVSRDAIDTHDANNSTDALSFARGASINEASGTPSTQNLMFPVMVKLKKTTIEADGASVPLTPGMTASLEVRTGSRRVIDYLFSPVIETLTGAGHER